MNRQIRRVGAAMIVLFVGLFVQLNYLQVFHASALDNNPLNDQLILKEYDQPRGDIVSADGQTLAESVKTSGEFSYLREYPEGPLFADITGFFSFTYGATGAEQYYNNILTGSKQKLKVSISGIEQYLTSQNHSQSISLTVSSQLQQAAATALGKKQGAVVALDPQTGAILAMYSNPTFDPNTLSSNNQQEVHNSWTSLLAESGNPLLPSAYRGEWPPGSTFKTITASAVYDHDPSLITKYFPVAGSIALPDTNLRLHNFGNEACGGELAELFTVSCDTGFGQIGLDLGANSLASEALAFGFDQSPPLDLPSPAASNFPSASSFNQNLPFLAYSAIGQENVRATPLQMALVAAGIANGGVIMTPHILNQVINSQGQVVSTYQPRPWITATSSATASQMTKLMEDVVNDGTGVEARIPGVQVAGKTGTAQDTYNGQSAIDAWFVAFAPASDPQIAVAVLVPDQPPADQYQGGTISAPIAKAVIEAWLKENPGASATTSSTTTP